MNEFWQSNSLSLLLLNITEIIKMFTLVKVIGDHAGSCWNWWQISWDKTWHVQTATSTRNYEIKIIKECDTQTGYYPHFSAFLMIHEIKHFCWHQCLLGVNIKYATVFASQAIIYYFCVEIHLYRNVLILSVLWLCKMLQCSYSYQVHLHFQIQNLTLLRANFFNFILFYEFYLISHLLRKN